MNRGLENFAMCQLFLLLTFVIGRLRCKSNERNIVHLMSRTVVFVLDRSLHGNVLGWQSAPLPSLVAVDVALQIELTQTYRDSGVKKIN